MADWAYIRACAQATAGTLPLIGNGDVASFEDFHARLEAAPELATIMLARGALVKPWIFTEVRVFTETQRLPLAHALHAPKPQSPYHTIAFLFVLPGANLPPANALHAPKPQRPYHTIAFLFTSPV